MMAAFAAEGLREDQKREFLVELARILALLHGRGVVHRDVKPGNVLVRPKWRSGFKGAVVLVDLSLAKQPGASTRTEAGLVMGTPAFLAPEFLMGHRGSTEATGAADVFGWGLIAWLVLFDNHATGLSMESEPIQFMHAYSAGNQSWLRPTAAEAMGRAGPLAGVVTAAIRALRDDPAARPQGGEELLASLQQWGAPTGIAGLAQPGQYTALRVETWSSLPESARTSAPQVISEAARPSMPSASSLPVSGVSPTSAGKANGNGAPLLIVAGGAVLVLGMLAVSIGGWLILRERDEPSEQAAPGAAPAVPGPAPTAAAASPGPQSEPKAPEPDPDPSPAPAPKRAPPVVAGVREVSVSVNVVIDGNKPGGNPWDVGSGPDPMVLLSAPNGQSRSFSCQDQYSCSGSLKLKLKPGDSVMFTAYDRDVAFNDHVGSYSGKYSGPGSRLQGRGGSATFKVGF